MIEEYQLRALPEQVINDEAVRQFVARDKGLDVRTIKAVRVLKRSIDARQRTIYINLKVRCYINEFPQDEAYQKTDYPNVEHARQVVVVGAGPGGLFAALRLIELGLRPIVVERGKNVRERKKDIARCKPYVLSLQRVFTNTFCPVNLYHLFHYSKNDILRSTSPSIPSILPVFEYCLILY